MRANPKVSICIPSYNHAPFLSTAIESALGQTYRNLEIIIVDDGSTDDSRAIAESYATRYPSLVKFFTHPQGRNLGISATSNLAFQKASGEFWSGLPSDDVYFPDKTERQLDFMDKHPQVGWSYGPAQCIDANGVDLPQLFGWDLSRGPHALERQIIRNHISAMTVMAPRSFLEEAGREDTRLIYGDWELFVRLLSLRKVGFIDQPLVKYRLHSENSSQGVEMQESLKRGLQVMTVLAEKAPTFGGELGQPQMRALLCMMQAYYYFSLDQSVAATECLRAVFKTDRSLKDNPRICVRWLERIGAQTQFYDWIAAAVRQDIERPGKKLVRQFESLAAARAALGNYSTGNLSETRRYALRSLRIDPLRAGDRELMTILMESVFGSRLTVRARRLKQQLARKANT
jgi:glycosyltransferase involved in cell wall biosynthesis